MINKSFKMSHFRHINRFYSWSRLLTLRSTTFSRNTITKTHQTCAGNGIMTFSGTDYTSGMLNFVSRSYCSNEKEDSRLFQEYDNAANETLISLTDMFEDIAETLNVDEDYDVSFENGVLTVVISKSWGTYVINKQTPNRQIWLSSPISGPKRYDLIDNKWVYSHDGKTLHELLTKEISEAFKHELNFTDCAFG